MNNVPSPQAFPQHHEPIMNPDIQPRSAIHRMDDDFYQTLMLDSHMNFFDYDVTMDDLLLSVMMPDEQRLLRRYPLFLSTLTSRHSISDDLHHDFISTATHCCTSFGKTSFPLYLDLNLSGDYRWYTVFAHSLTSNTNQVDRVIGFLRDVQAEKQSELCLQSLSLYRNAVDYASLFVYEFDLPGFKPFPSVDTKRHDDEFFPCEQYLDPRFLHLIHPESHEAFTALLHEQALLNAFHEQCYEHTLVLRILNLRIEWVWARLIIHLCSSTSGKEVRGIIYIQTIQDQIALRERATLDSITGLYNRGTTEEQINNALLAATTPSCFFIFDVDNFKAINDTHGHAEGDYTLKLVAATLREHLRQSDILGRIGGDEFVALLTGVETDGFVQRKAKELLDAIAKLKSPAVWQGGVSLSISIGIAHAPEQGQSFDSLYRVADSALYLAKGKGKNRFCISS